MSDTYEMFHVVYFFQKKGRVFSCDADMCYDAWIEMGYYSFMSLYIYNNAVILQKIQCAAHSKSILARQ